MKLLIVIVAILSLMVLPGFAKADTKDKSYKNSEKSLEVANENAKFKKGKKSKKKKKNDDDEDVDKDDDEKKDKKPKKIKKDKKQK